MPDVNKANRQVCDLDIRALKDKKPILFFDTANTTTVGMSADSVYAMAKGARKISFPNPAEGTMTVEAQVYPFKYFALFSDGTIDNTAIYGDKKEITCETAGELTIDPPETGTIQVGTVFAYPVDCYGDEDEMIEGTFADGKFTATEADKIEVGEKYEVSYLINRTGVKKISFNSKKLPRDYYITMSTVDKDEDGVFTPFRVVAYKATIQRNFELSFSSEGDPASITATFDLMEDKNGDVLDFIEISEDAE